MSDDPEPAGALDPARYDRWFDRPWGRHAFGVERDALPMSEDSFDVAVAVTLLEFAEHPQRLIDELVRVTRPGGRVSVATLNPKSPWGLAHRRELRDPPWSGACLYTPQQLRGLLERYGEPRLHGALYAPGMLPGLARPARLAERAGRSMPGLGAFQIAVLDLPDHPRRGAHLRDRSRAPEP